ncbi:MAG: hypothetical protein K2M87_04525 [Muribaculaceae bacterium]|nr:hypothetical protein [Muribaculaceae bacterium]
MKILFSIFVGMKGALIILIFTIVIGIILYLADIFNRRKAENSGQAEGGSADFNTIGTQISGNSEESIQKSDSSDSDNPSSDKSNDDTAEQSECCGLHLVCEKDSLSPMSADIIYYDDEELDRFRGREQLTYTPEETEEFRDVLMTLRPEEIAGWARSLTQRRLELPSDVRDELLMIINEQRRGK